MALPTQTDYQTALQNPKIAFRDPELQHCLVEMNDWGIPRPRSGGFALTFHLLDGPREYAVRCFHRDVPELRAKYDAISKNLRTDTTRLFETFEYQAQGVKIAGYSYPIIKMAWARGVTLGAWVDSHSDDKVALRNLAKNLRTAIGQLADMGVAHGDIQHGNLIVAHDGSVRFIDYDGMYVPGMEPGNGHEVGHPNYQHKQRMAMHFGPMMDRFSAAVVLTAIELIIADRNLWDDFNNGENLLFTRADFDTPHSSTLFNRAAGIPGAGGLATRLRTLALANIEQVPSLEDFLAGRRIPTVVAPQGAPQPGRPTGPPANANGGLYPVLEASDPVALLGRVSDWVEVVGVVATIKELQTKSGNSYALINFGDWRQGAFTVVVWPRAWSRLQTRIKRTKLAGLHVSVRGLLTRYLRPATGVEVPQIELNEAEDAALFVDLTARRGGSPPVLGFGSTGKSNNSILDQLHTPSTPQPQKYSSSSPGPLPKPSNAQLLAGLNKPQPTAASAGSRPAAAGSPAAGSPGAGAPLPPAPQPAPSGSPGASTSLPPAPQPPPSGSLGAKAPQPPIRQPAPRGSSGAGAPPAAPQPNNPPTPQSTKDATLPMIGAIIGGIIGSAVQPCLGTAIGAWIGWHVGKALREP